MITNNFHFYGNNNVLSISMLIICLYLFFKYNPTKDKS